MLKPYLCLLITVTFSTPTGDFTHVLGCAVILPRKITNSAGQGRLLPSSRPTRNSPFVDTRAFRTDQRARLDRKLGKELGCHLHREFLETCAPAARGLPARLVGNRAMSRSLLYTKRGSAFLLVRSGQWFTR